MTKREVQDNGRESGMTREKIGAEYLSASGGNSAILNKTK
jgi:hypothetical protein